ncbi:MAG: 50S ribosomal protein L9 [Alphaproteobacteria bacterium]
MKVVLLTRIEKLGTLGDVVTVKDGYARNFLIPQKKALRATNENMKQFEAQRAHLETQNKHFHSKAESFAHKLQDFKAIVVRQASEGGILYGSVSARDVAKLVSEQGEMVTAAQVKMPQPIKTVGVHTVPVQIHPEIRVDVLISIAPSEEEAKAQLKPAPVVVEFDHKEHKGKTSKKSKKEAEEELPLE